MSFVNLLKKYQMIIISAFAVIVCVVASLLGSLYLTRMENAMWNQLVTDLTEVSYQGAHAFETYIDKERESIGRIASRGLICIFSLRTSSSEPLCFTKMEML